METVLIAQPAAWKIATNKTFMCVREEASKEGFGERRHLQRTVSILLCRAHVELN